MITLDHVLSLVVLVCLAVFAAGSVRLQFDRSAARDAERSRRQRACSCDCRECEAARAQRRRASDPERIQRDPPDGSFHALAMGAHGQATWSITQYQCWVAAESDDVAVDVLLYTLAESPPSRTTER